MWKRFNRLKCEAEGRLKTYQAHLGFLMIFITAYFSHLTEVSSNLACELHKTSMSNFCDWRELS
jgi:hypothetical protein